MSDYSVSIGGRMVEDDGLQVDLGLAGVDHPFPFIYGACPDCGCLLKRLPEGPIEIACVEGCGASFVVVVPQSATEWIVYRRKRYPQQHLEDTK